MSLWRVVTKAVEELGGSATVEQVIHHTKLEWMNVVSGMNRACLHGVLKGPGKGANRKYQLTDLGRDLLENRITQIAARPGGKRFVATWLSSLPRDIRLKEAA